MRNALVMYAMRSSTKSDAIRKACGLPTTNRAFTATASIVGAAAGAAAGAIAGPIGAALGGVLGAIAGAAAGHTIEEHERDRARDVERLDREIGVIGGDIGAPATALGRVLVREEHPSSWFLEPVDVEGPGRSVGPEAGWWWAPVEEC